MSLFKRAFVRGVTQELTRRGLAAFPSKEAADAASDAVADAMPGPEISEESGHQPDVVAEAANKLMEIAQMLMAQSGGAAPHEAEAALAGGAGGPPMPPPSDEASKTSALLMKFAQEVDLNQLAAKVAEEVMVKAAEETKVAAGTGSLVQGGDKQNTPAAAAKNDTVAAMDEKNRPQGKYLTGVGNTDMKTRPAMIGELKPQPEQPANSPAGSNSLTEDEHKSASLRAKLANKLVELHNGKDLNSQEQAAKHDTVAELDLKFRPTKKYVVSPGGANFKEPQDTRVGKETPHPAAPSNSPSGSNSVIEASKAAEEDAFLLLFSKTAADVKDYLPPSIQDADLKVACISEMIGMDHDGRQDRINTLWEMHHKVAGDVSKMVEEMKKKDKKGGEEKKASTILDRVREIATQPKA